MTSAGTWFVAAATAALAMGAAKAETEAEYLIQHTPPAQVAPPSPVTAHRAMASPVRPQASRSTGDPARLAPRPPERPALFAPTSAATARPLTAAQREEWRFLKDAAAASRFETDASRMALGRSTDPALRSLADALVRQRSAATDELVHMLHMRGMAPPMLANDQRKTLNRLAKLRGRHFDRLYIDEVALRGQQQDVQLFERAAVAAQDSHLKGWIERTLPMLREQLATAELVAQPPLVQAASSSMSRPGAKGSKIQASSVMHGVPVAGRDGGPGSRTSGALVTRTSLPVAGSPASEWNDSGTAPALESIRVGTSAPGP